MNDSAPMHPRGVSIDAAAADWVIRRDRGLTAAEQDAFSQWLAADPRHRAAYAEQRWSWEELERLTGLQTSLGAVPDRRLLAPAGRSPASRWRRLVAWPLAAAIVALVAVSSFRPPGSAPPLRPVRLEPCEQQRLSDGSEVVLNRGASIKVEFSSRERRVQLEEGEAHFTVVPEPGRPFVVEAAGVAVRAVGTAFSVAREAGAIAVLVTEGRVSVLTRNRTAPGAAPLVAAGERATFSLATSAVAPVIAPVTAQEVAARLAWKPRLLEFDDATLMEIAAEFNRCNPVHLTIADPALQTRRLSATIRSDNVEGFVNLLESDFGLRAERSRNGVIALRTVE